MKKIIISSIIAIAGTSLGLQAQQLPLYSNYLYTQHIFNPALSGARGVTEAAVFHRRQWASVPGAPTTSAISLNGALNGEKVGYSVYGYVDNTDIVQRYGFYGSYAYHLQLSKKNTLSFGLAAGYLNNTINQQSVKAKDVSDPVLGANLNYGGTFDLNFGLNLTIGNFKIGAAVPQLIGAPIKYNESLSVPVQYNLIRHYLFNAQYDFEIQGDKMVLTPFANMRVAEGVPMQFDGGLMFNMKELGYVGATYRSDFGVTGSIGVHLTDELTIGYAQEFSTYKYASSLGTTNEFMLIYKFGSNKDKQRLENEIKKLKTQQRKQSEETEDLVNERLEEFKRELETQNSASVEEQKAKIKAELEALKAEREAQNANNPNNNNGGNPTNNNNTGGNMNGYDANGNPIGGNPRNNNNNGGNIKPNKSSIGGYNDANYASNVPPGSAGYYIVGGVFGSEANAERHRAKLSNQGLDVRVFRDPGNNMYYVYLMKFNSYQQASDAKDSNLNGQYNGKLWIKSMK